MMIDNNILIKFTKYNDDVVYDFDGNTMILYDNSKLLVKLPVPNLIFTGIRLDFSDIVHLTCRDKESNVINYSLWGNYLYLEGRCQEGMFYTTKFTPTDAGSEINEFIANFLEIKES